MILEWPTNEMTYVRVGGQGAWGGNTLGISRGGLGTRYSGRVGGRKVGARRMIVVLP